MKPNILLGNHRSPFRRRQYQRKPMTSWPRSIIKTWLIITVKYWKKSKNFWLMWKINTWWKKNLTKVKVLFSLHNFSQLYWEARIKIREIVCMRFFNYMDLRLTPKNNDKSWALHRALCMYDVCTGKEYNLIF